MSNPPQFEDMSDRYNQEISGVAYWFLNKLKDLPNLYLTESQVDKGTDSLFDGLFDVIVLLAHDYWLEKHEYDLSYNQLNVAFWWAVRESAKLEVIE